MSERGITPSPRTAEAEWPPLNRDVLLLRDVHLEYQVYEDRRLSLGTFVRQGFKRRTLRHIHALRGITLTLQEREAVGILGANGSGKSTLLRAMSGLLQPSHGEIRARSLPILLGASAALNNELSGRRNILLGCTAMGLSRREVAHRVDEIVCFAGLEQFADIPVRAYSSGMRSRLQFAIAAAVEPDILLIDEVLAVGDKTFRERSSKRIKKLTDAAGLVVIVSHSMQSLLEICNRAIWMEQGQVVADGPAAEIITAYGEQ